MSAESSRAVFLSYASQDAEAARRICEALRGEGVEVWFDQSELRGGDAWDQKIRRQIKECVLFVPIISANTQARAEGYFRREWKLAVERTHDMADHVAFLVPIVIDRTTDAEAFVPEKFREVQWTRLAGGAADAAFCARVQSLLVSRSAASNRPSAEANSTPGRPGATSLPPKRRGPLAPMLVAGLVVTVIGVGWWRPWRAAPPSTALPATTTAPSAPPSSPPPKPLTEAQRLVAQARAMQGQHDWETRDALGTIETLLKRAVDSDPSDADALAAYSQLSSTLILLRYDRSTERVELARKQAEMASRLAPNSFEAKFALAISYYQTDKEETERRLREALQQSPNDQRGLRWLGNALRGVNRLEEALEVYEKSCALPGGDPWSLWEKAWTYRQQRRFEDTLRVLDESLALAPIGKVAGQKALLLLQLRGDVAGANAALRQAPTDFLRDDRGAHVAWLIGAWERDNTKCQAALSQVTRDYFEDNEYNGPKGFLAGFANSLVGRTVAAEADWRAALGVVEKRLSRAPRDPGLLLWKARLLACLGEKENATAAYELFRQTETANSVSFYTTYWARVHTLALLGQTEGAIRIIRGVLPSRSGGGAISPISLQRDPVFEPLHGLPEFAALVEEAERTWRVAPKEIPKK